MADVIHLTIFYTEAADEALETFRQVAFAHSGVSFLRVDAAYFKSSPEYCYDISDSGKLMQRILYAPVSETTVPAVASLLRGADLSGPLHCVAVIGKNVKVYSFENLNSLIEDITESVK
jgi:hypothetical protein